MKTEDVRRCSFCGKPKSHVKKLFTGGQANICDQCIMLAKGLINNSNHQTVNIEPDQTSQLSSTHNNNVNYEEWFNNPRFDEKQIGSRLIEMGLVSENDIIEALGRELGLQVINLEKYLLKVEIVRILPEHICKKHKLIAIDKNDNVLTVAMANPLSILPLENIENLTNLKVKVVLATNSKIEKALIRIFV